MLFKVLSRIVIRVCFVLTHNSRDSLARLAGPQDKSQDKYDDPTAKIWSVYMSEATPHDKALIESWSKDMDGILIFVCLFTSLLGSWNRLIQYV